MGIMDVTERTVEELPSVTPAAGGLTVASAMAYVESELTGGGKGRGVVTSIDGARAEALFFVADLLGMEPARLQAGRDRVIDADEARVLRGWVGRRLKGEPMQYITGVAGFRGLKLKVTPDVLIPRPETELLAGAALEHIGLSEMSVLDLCTGSGCVAISIAAEAPGDLMVVATDISAAAIVVARENASLNGVAGRVEFREGDLFEFLGNFLGGSSDKEVGRRFDLVVTNPPYVADGDMAGLQREVRDHEPRLALAAGPDGLNVIKRIIDGAPRHMEQGGVLLMEIGYGHGGAVRALLEESGHFVNVQVLKDYSGIERIVKAVCS